MNQYIKRSIIIALVAGFVVILFGGWAMAVAGAVAGMGLGYFLGSKTTATKPLDAIKGALVPSLVSAGILLVISLLEDIVIANAIGQTPNDINTIIQVNLVGILSLIGFSLLLTATHTLPERQQRAAQIILIA